MSIVHAFVEHLPEPQIGGEEAAELERVLGEALEACRSAWPRLRVEARDFAVYLAQRLPAGRPVPVAVQALHVRELYLAFACQSGDADAIAALEATYASHLDAVLGAFEGQGLSRDDLRQTMRRKLFVADERGPARIARYSGEGSFVAWLRITVRRAALNAMRGAAVDARAPLDDDVFAFPQSLGDPELDYLKQTYSAQFREAFLEAVAALSARERTLLRQSVVHGLTVRQIGRMYRVHHGTAARWIAQAREHLVDATRAALVRRLDVSERELDSIIAMIQSRLDVSVKRALRS
jgi:RNA polymerase sigma-70 factor (ECF subfamily)